MGALRLLQSGALTHLLATGELPQGLQSTPGPERRAVSRRNLWLAVGSPLGAAGLYFYQRANPYNPVELLRRMEGAGPSLPAALASGRGTLVEFYAPWCVSCRDLAPFMYRLEKKYSRDVNFVLVDGADPANRNLVQMFGVDGVPHFGFISRDRKLLNTLIGEVPPEMIEDTIKQLI